MKRNGSRFFIKFSPLCMVLASILLTFDVEAARVTSGRNAPVSTRKTVSSASKTTETKTEEITSTASEPEEETIVNKADKFGNNMSADASGDDFDDLAAQIRKQRAALEAKENTETLNAKQRDALVKGKNACDTGLRQCMQAECGSDFTKCALDGDSVMGDKFNKCRRNVECTGEEFKLFTNEIKADRDLNVQMASYNNIIECGNAYNSCMVSECGTTFNKCLGKANADRAIQNCAKIAKDCTEQDSGLVSRFGTAIGKLREVAETEVKADEKRMYELRDLMRNQCNHLGATFDERSFDCVYNVKFFAGEDQSVPMASRNLYAGDSFVCMQEFFGVNVTTYRENAYRETRAQTAASSAMLGSGLGTAAGLVTSGAVGRALETQKAKKELKEECRKDLGYKIDANGNCVSAGKKVREILEDTKKAVQKGKQKLKEGQEEFHNQLQYAGKNLEEDLNTATKVANAGNELYGEFNETLDKTRQAAQTAEGMATDASGAVFKTVDQALVEVGQAGDSVKKVVDPLANLVENGIDGVAAYYTKGASAPASVDKNRLKYQAQVNASGGGDALSNSLNNYMNGTPQQSALDKAMNNALNNISPQEAQLKTLTQSVFGGK